jgi:hypothetical protein
MPAVLSDVRCLPTTVKSAFCYSLLVATAGPTSASALDFAQHSIDSKNLNATSFMIIAGVFTV